MREYELTNIVQPDAPPEKAKDLQARISDLIVKADGITLMWDDWGKRKLAYEIKKFQKGQYILVSFLGGKGSIPEVERTLRLDPDVLRFLTVKVSEKVADVEARIAEAKKEEAERARRREEREQLEAERAAREAAATAAAPPPEPVASSEPATPAEPEASDEAASDVAASDVDGLEVEAELPKAAEEGSDAAQEAADTPEERE